MGDQYAQAGQHFFVFRSHRVGNDVIFILSAGYEVITAADAIIGTALAVKEQPNLVLLDISIPAGDGFIVAERLQKRSNTIGIPFIFITASKQYGLREKAIRLGAASFFEKPYEIDELLTSIDSAMGVG